MLELLSDPHAWIAFVTLSALEIVLGIDNIIFISILVSRLPPERREAAASPASGWRCSPASRCCSPSCGSRAYQALVLCP